MSMPYVFESPAPMELGTDRIGRLELLAQRLIATNNSRSTNGQMAFEFSPDSDGDILNQEDRADTEFLTEVCNTMSEIRADDIRMITVRWVDDAELLNNYLRRNRDTMIGNLHAEFKATPKDDGYMLGEPNAGLIHLSLFGKGILCLDDVITEPRDETKYFECKGRFRVSAKSRTSDMTNHHKLLYGLNDHFLRGPVKLKPFLERYQKQVTEAETWNYLHPKTVHMVEPNRVDGQVSIIVDLNSGGDRIRRLVDDQQGSFQSFVEN